MCWLDEATLVVGRGYRTNAAAHQQLSDILGREGVTVERRVLLHHRVDVGDGHEHSRRSVFLFRPRELIEIARIVIVDRAPGQVAHVPYAVAVFLRWTVDRLELLQRIVGVIGLEPSIDHGLPGDLGEEVRGTLMLIHARHVSI